ncbi:MFS transporter [Periweissella cryptocerci]|uniref:MFS transporter n=1 Tax=Periweissella cryptocerci TaxID=2506420 RepID=A0A4P6YTR4_9LACO|nr:MFS transporter [Periweissella cryptocerci]QBO36154.1 MFS transporter [Periweissella cryptocerci]
MNLIKRNPAFRAIQGASIFNLVGLSIFNLVFLIYAQQLPFKNIAISLVAIANTVPSLVSLIAGYIVDKQTKSLVNLTILIRVGQTGLFLILAWFINQNANVGIFALVLGINIVSDLLGEFTRNAQLPLIKQNVADEDIPTAMSINASLAQLLELITQVVGVGLLSLIGNSFAVIGLINAISFLASGLFFLQGRKYFKSSQSANRQVNTKLSLKDFRYQLVKAYNTLKVKPYAVTTIVIMIFAFSLSAPIDPLINLSLANRENLLIAGNFGLTITVFNVVFATAMIMGSIFAGTLLKKMSLHGAVGFAIGSILGISMVLLLQFSVGITLIVLGISGIASGLVMPKLNTFILQSVADDNIALVGGALTTVLTIGVPIAQALLLVIGNTLTLTIAWLTELVISIMLLGYLLLMTMKKRKAIG